MSYDIWDVVHRLAGSVQKESLQSRVTLGSEGNFHSIGLYAETWAVGDAWRSGHNTQWHWWWGRQKDIGNTWGEQTDGELEGILEI